MCLSARRRSTCPAAGFGIGIATTYRYIREAVDVLAGLAPTLATAVHAARIKVFVILDGILLPIDRIAADTPYYSGKHKRHGMNVQVLTDLFGRLLWALPALRHPRPDRCPRPRDCRSARRGWPQVLGRHGGRGGDGLGVVGLHALVGAGGQGRGGWQDTRSVTRASPPDRD